MNGSLFDTLTKQIARRRLMGGLAGLALSGTVHRPAASRAAFPKWPTNCFPYPSCCITPILNGPGCVCEGCDPDENDDGNDGGGGGDDGGDQFTLASYQTQTTYEAIAGISGAGSILTANGLAHFSLFASRMAGFPDLPDDAVVPFARVQWRDPQAGFMLESTRTVLYGPIDGVEGGRGIAGMMRANDAGEYFFAMSAVATGTVGDGLETVSLLVGDAVNDDPDVGIEVEPAGFSYAAEGELIAGDLQLLDIELAEQIVVHPSP